MANKLLIVESPAKAKTINKYLGSEYMVIASFGHVRDLPRKNSSIDVDNNFKADYQLSAKSKKHVDEIVSEAKKANEIILATDPDREGEAIAWHIAEILREKKLDKKPITRVAFYEITKPAIIAALENPREIDANLVDAQQARLTLDFLLGFNISPLLWRKIRPGLSAGRVQSPALRLICEREDEIKAFVVENYYSVHLHTLKNTTKLDAKLVLLNDKKIDVRTIDKKEDAEAICRDLAGYKTALVSNITKKQKKKNPLPPFITSSLQIEAARKLGFTTDKTMKTAQGLYEGVAIANETVGLISYMRTDSVHLSAQAVEDIRDYIANNYPAEYLPKTQVNYVSKVKNAQEAHEAIRPTGIARTPQSLKAYLTPDQYKLYELIWQRTVSCQCAPAILDTTSIDLSVAKAIFRLNGIMVNFDGFMRVYQEGNEDGADDDAEAKLPELTLNEELPIKEINFLEHQTEPKPRYTEASLVKSLEELGIGRPSTYASIISTLKKREYVILDKKRFTPTDIGDIVSKFLTQHLTNYVDYQFTAHLEDTLDVIANGGKAKLPVLEQFWQELKSIVAEKQGIARTELTAEKLEENCPECGKHLLLRLGKYGKFIGCSGYPDCNYMRKVDKATGESVEIVEPEIIPDRVCPLDGGQLLIRVGKYGKFISCKNYPKCKHIENIAGPGDENALTCPECKQGKIVSKKGRFGVFYSCNNYPTCKTIFKNKPIDKACSQCAYPLMMEKVTKRKGTQHVCPKCEHTEDIEAV